MKDVICYRTNDLDDLRKIAKVRNISLSTLTNEIIHDYIHNNKLIKKYDMYNDGRKFISAAFENLEPSTFDKVASIGAKECTRGAKMSMNNFSLKNLLDYFKDWIELNNLKLSEFDESDRIRWICETKMGRNYNEICAKCFKEVLNNFGYSSNVESAADEDFEIIFSKNGNN